MIARFLIKAMATLGVGLLPKAPGTFGSLVAVLVWWFWADWSLSLQALLILGAFVVALGSIHFYEKAAGRHDSSEIVIDELVGMWIALLGAPKSASVFVMGFLLFRLFDIWKPYPVSWFDEKVPGAFGTLMDDVVAGMYAALCLHLTLYLGSHFDIFHF